MRLWLVPALLTLTAFASTRERTATDEALEDLGKERCEAAVEGLNRGLKAGDPQAYYWTGALMHYGVCLKADPGRAVPYLELAAKHRVAKAARLLVLTHGLGRGVPQSYVEAGRWMQASQDITELIRENVDLTVEEKAETLDARSWSYLGVVGTFWALVGDKTTHPNISSFRAQVADAGTVGVEVSLGPDGLKYKMKKFEVTVPTRHSGLQEPRSSSAFRSEVEAGLAAALNELPSYPLPRRSTRFVFDVAFR